MVAEIRGSPEGWSGGGLRCLPRSGRGPDTEDCDGGRPLRPLLRAPSGNAADEREKRMLRLTRPKVIVRKSSR